MWSYIKAIMLLVRHNAVAIVAQLFENPLRDARGIREIKVGAKGII